MEAPPQENLPRKMKPTVFIVLCATLWASICQGFHVAFFPQEALHRGAQLKFNLIQYVSENPGLFQAWFPLFFAHSVHRFGAKNVYFNGLYLVGVTNIFLGLCTLFCEGQTFLFVSFWTRQAQVIGDCAVFVSSVAILVKEYSNYSASFFGYYRCLGVITVTCFSFLNFAYFQAWTSIHYFLTQAISGIVMIVGALGASYFFVATNYQELPSPQLESPEDRLFEDVRFGQKLVQIVKLPSTLLSIGSILTASFIMSYIVIGLEPLHLRHFALEPLSWDKAFIQSTSTIVAAFSCLFWGFLSDRVFAPATVILNGTILTTFAFLLLGPVNIIPIRPSLNLTITMLVLQGIGISAQWIGGFSLMTKGQNFGMEINTLAMISGIWLSTVGTGVFWGPLAGVLMAGLLDFSAFILPLVIMQLILCISSGIFIFFNNRRSMNL